VRVASSAQSRALDVLIGSRPSRCRRARVERLSFAIARIQPQARCEFPNGPPPETARWKRRVPRVVFHYSTTTRSVAPRPKVSGWYLSSAFDGGTTNTPGVVARATYE